MEAQEVKHIALRDITQYLAEYRRIAGYKYGKWTVGYKQLDTKEVRRLNARLGLRGINKSKRK